MQKRVGLIRLQALRAPDLRQARTFTEYVGGPRACVTVRLGTDGLKPGDVAGLALWSRRYAWIAVERGSDGFTLAQIDEETGRSSRVPMSGPDVWLRVECDFVNNNARFSHSPDGERYTGIGQSRFLGEEQAAVPSVCCSLFSYSTQPDAEGGHADFDSFLVTWP